MTLQGKVVLVTGGGSGIGLASARGLLAVGARVAITGRDEAKLARAAAELKPGDRLLHHGTDVTDPEAVGKLVRQVTERWAGSTSSSTTRGPTSSSGRCAS
jgi:NAD(P)-dependent dehydrogenase (short-subunit alcohol dehydrogenase family)